MTLTVPAPHTPARPSQRRPPPAATEPQRTTSADDVASAGPQLSAMQLVRPSQLPRRLAKWLAALFVLAALAMMFVPWQQTAVGKGKVVAFDPLKRPQTLEAPVSGVIRRWYVKREGEAVRAGQPLLEIWDNDPNYLARLEQQQQALELKREAAQRKADSYSLQVTQYVQARDAAVRKAQEDVRAAEQKVLAATADLRAAEAALVQEELNYRRQLKLADEGLVSRQVAEIQTRKYREAEQKRLAAENYVEAAKRDESAKREELGKATAEADAKIESARAFAQAALGDAAAASKELLELETKRAQQEQIVRAPHDGFVLRLRANKDTEMVKQGDPLVDIVPSTQDRAVELWIAGNDVPLVTPGRQVRLLFEGWPGVQFAGWPSVAVGTFGGEVVNIDASDNGKGEFRVLVVPDGEEPWPADRFLRQGVRASGWVLLNRVPLGWEIWRQLNGFPPVQSTEPAAESYEKDPTVFKVKRK